MLIFCNTDIAGARKLQLATEKYQDSFIPSVNSRKSTSLIGRTKDGRLSLVTLNRSVSYEFHEAHHPVILEQIIHRYSYNWNNAIFLFLLLLLLLLDILLLLYFTHSITYNNTIQPFGKVYYYCYCCCCCCCYCFYFNFFRLQLNFILYTIYASLNIF